MLNQTLSSTLTLIQNFAKANVILKKAGKLLTKKNNIKDAEIDFEEVSRVTNGQINDMDELLQIKKLRSVICQLHDTLFESIRQLSQEDRQAAFAMVRAYAITYKSQIAHLEEEYKECCKKFEDGQQHDSGFYAELNQKLGSIVNSKEDAKYYFDTYTALQHYIGGLTNSLNDGRKGKN